MKYSAITFLAVSLLCVGRGGHAESGSAADKADRVSCLNEFNDVRVRAGLDPFTAETDEQKELPLTNAEYIKTVCSTMREGRTFTPEDVVYRREGTYAYSSQSGESGDCSIAVKYWTGAWVNFGDLPAMYTSDKGGIYARSRNRSFVALFNPNEGATMDCAFFVCPPPTSTTTATPVTDGDHGSYFRKLSSAGQVPQAKGEKAEKSESITGAETPKTAADQAGQPSKEPAREDIEHQRESEETDEELNAVQPAGVLGRRLSTESGDTLKALVCLTHPAALVVGKRPFS